MKKLGFLTKKGFIRQAHVSLINLFLQVEKCLIIPNLERYYMKNIFREILKKLPKPKNKIIADDPKDQKTADQLSKLLNYKIVQDRKDSK